MSYGKFARARTRKKYRQREKYDIKYRRYIRTVAGIIARQQAMQKALKHIMEGDIAKESRGGLDFYIKQ